MSNQPDTRYSLLLRICDPTDGAAWSEFWQLYEPVIYRMARRYGLQDADARDLTQEVLTAIHQAIPDWQPDPERGRFRTWLHAVVRNKTITAMRRLRPYHCGTGDTSMIRRLEAEPVTPDELFDDGVFEIEVRRSAFRHAADRVKQDVHVTTWEAFWQTSVLGRPIEDVAQQLKLSMGSVYAARSRVLARLRREIESTLSSE